MPTNLKNLKVAVIHDWLNGMRGGEHVLDAILEIFPQAEIFTLFYSPGKLNQRIESRPIHASFLNRLPRVEKYYRLLLPLLPMAIESFDLNQFDLVISSSHCVAKGVIPRPNALHVCYSNTPMRYIWDQTHNYFKSTILHFFITPFLHYLRMWDNSSSNRVDHFLANSVWVKNRIMRYYRRNASVIYPFFNPGRFSPTPGKKEDFYLVVSAFAPYKRIELAIQTCEQLGRKLIIIGSGQQERFLRALAGPNTSFLGKAPNETLKEMYSKAKALICPGQEDFGITPLEAMASGTPVIAFNQGGVTETVVENETGLFFNEQTVESLSQAILTFEESKTDWTEACVKRAHCFARDLFLKKFETFVESAWQEHCAKESLSRSELSF
jgi:glycosyltransferase involved in cell wall biosynthesis